MANKTIKLKKAWGLHLKGAILSPNTPIADLLIRSGRAEAVEPKPELKKTKLPLKQASA